MMTLSRFIFGLTILFCALLSWNVATDPLAIGDWAFTLGGAIGGLVGALIWGLILWTPIRLIRGREKAPHQLQFVLYTAAIMIAAYILFRIGTGTPLTDSQVDNYAAQVADACFNSERPKPQNASLSDQLLSEFYSCYGKELVGSMTEEELHHAAIADGPTADVREKAESAGTKCAKTLTPDNRTAPSNADSTPAT